MEKRAAAYIRVSTEEQTEYSPQAQLAEIRRYADSHGYLLPSPYIFVDEGISGKHTGRRPGFQAMIALAKTSPKPFDAILLWKFSRFARNREDSIVYKSMLRRQLGIDVISVSEPLSDDKTAILMEAIIEAMDEYYSINLAEEVKRGMTEKARRGELQNAPPFGYRAEHNLLVPIPEEASLVQALFRRFAGGMSLLSLAKWLNDLGVTTHRGRPFENRTVAYLLSNPVYLGKLRWNPAGRGKSPEQTILADARHQALVSQALWDTVQRKLAADRVGRTPRSRPRWEHRDWISGLVRCAACGAPLVFVKPHYWRCNGYARGRCKISQHMADGALKELLLARMARDTAGSARLTCTKLSPGSQSEERERLAARQAQLSRRLSRLREAYLAGAEDLKSYQETKEALERQQSALEEEFLRCHHKRETPQASCSSLVELLSAPEEEMERKKAAAHAVVDHCVLDKAARRLDIYYQTS